MILALIDHTGQVDGAEIARVAAAITKRLWSSVCPAYGIAPVTVVPGAAAGAYELGIFLHSDQAGDLAYHSRTPAGQPYGSIFLEDCRAAGEAWSVAAGHEADEATVDPDCARFALGLDGKLRCYEVDDPCEDLVVTVDGVPLSDTVPPDWFTDMGMTKTLGGTPIARMRRTGGGYVQIWTDAGVVTDAERAPKAHRAHPSARAARRIAAHPAMRSAT